MELALVHVPGEELKCGWSSDVVWVQSLELHVLVVEGGLQFVGKVSNDIRIEGVGDNVEIFHVMELLEYFQGGLQSFDFRS